MTLRFDWKYLLLALAVALGLSLLNIALLQNTLSYPFTDVQLVQTTALMTMAFLLFYLFVQYRALQRRRLFIALLDRLPASLVSKDNNGKILYCNQSYANLFGCTAAEMFDQFESEFTDKDSVMQSFTPLAQPVIDKGQAIGQPVSALYEQASPQADKSSYYTSVKLPYLNINQRACTLIYAQDVSEFHQYKQQAELYQTQLEKVLEASEEGLWEWDLVENKATANQRMLEIFKIEKLESLEDFEAIIYPDDRELVHQAIETLIANQAPFNIEFRIVDDKGNIAWIWDRGRVASVDENNQVTSIVGIAMDITEDKANEEQIRKLAYYDPLTQLKNRSKLQKNFDEMRFSLIEGQPEPWYGLFFIDLDRFKHLNDNYGHGHGDELLKIIGQRLMSFVCKNSLLCRLGGDEFIVVFPMPEIISQTRLEHIETLATRLLDELNQPCQLVGSQGDNPICYMPRASLGGITFKLRSDSDLLELRRLADIGLYRAKAEGGGVAHLFNLEEQDQMLSVNRLQKLLEKGIENNEFELYYQPVINRDGQICGAEALLRWQSAEQGLIMPDTFMPIAEESHAIVELGNQVIHMACRQLEQWQQATLSAHFTMAINLSAKQLWQHNFVDDFIHIIEQYAINPHQLIVEVTESVFIHDLQEASDKLMALKRLGINIALDDFGTGYSSLNYLRHLPLDELKIDKSFIQSMLEDAKASIMVNTVIELAKQLELTVVAEGVETAQHFELLSDLSVELYQGYYFAKPLPIDDFTAFYQSYTSLIT